MKFRKRGEYDTRQASIDAATVMVSPDRAQQQFRLEADINELVRRFGLTGQMPVLPNSGTPVFGDFSSDIDYHQAMNLVRQADERFASLPAELRLRFRNDPGAFVDFVLDPENRDELADLGLLSREAASRIAQDRDASPSEGSSTPPISSPSGDDSGGPK